MRERPSRTAAAPAARAPGPAPGDPRGRARRLAAAHEAVLSGARPPIPPRTVIAESWHRMLHAGVDPDRGETAELLSAEQLEHQRRSSGLGDILDTLREGLGAAADAGCQMMVVTDADGKVLWRSGARPVLKQAYGLGFVEGADWKETVVGTNAIGTALVARRPVQVTSAEHFVRTHHAWTCAAAPVRHPEDGRLLGVIDVSGPAATVHPSTLALVHAVARLAESELRNAHLEDLQRLRSVAAPLLARIPGRALVADAHGWVAAVSGLAPPDRVLLPDRMPETPTWLPALGPCAFEPLPGGWLVRLTGEEAAEPTRAVLDVSQPHAPTLTVSGASGTWTHALSPRHAELLLVLAGSPGGRTAAQLAGDLFGDAERTVTVRAEVSRLRRRLAGLLQHRPYRFTDGVAVEVVRPAAAMDLLPHSTAPAVRRMREA